MAPKKLRIRGEAQVPDESKEPATEDEKWLLVPGRIENFTYTGKNVRVPGSLIGAAIRKYWPGMYTPILGGESKLAYTWEDYEIAPYPGFASAADAVIKKFWRNYRVATEHKDRADVVLRNMCRKLTRQQWYNQRITCIGHFYAEQGVGTQSPRLCRTRPAMTIDEFMSKIRNSKEKLHSNRLWTAKFSNYRKEHLEEGPKQLRCQDQVSNGFAMGLASRASKNTLSANKKGVYIRCYVHTAESKV
ncbi:uncharacterized protein [Lolium perenne]|uniref:uncharacterized protein n=1 Tax=Lolium perenne TaxID=4522 RepID=UPI003A99CC25